MSLVFRFQDPKARIVPLYLQRANLLMKLLDLFLIAKNVDLKALIVALSLAKLSPSLL